jgi:hypothetical protein
MAEAAANDNNTSKDGVAPPPPPIKKLQHFQETIQKNEDGDDDVNVVEQAIVFEIVRLFSTTNGRSCCCHKTCGRQVLVGNLLRLVQMVVDIDGRIETASKLV